MKAITLHQPHATFVELRLKWLETRSWAPPKALIGERLLIHAAAKDTEGRCPHDGRRMDWHGDAWSCPLCGDEWTPDEEWWKFGIDATRPPLPLGAIVASCILADAVPMVDVAEAAFRRRAPGAGFLVVDDDLLELAHDWEEERSYALVAGTDITDVSDQRPYGDFAPGRWAWILEDIKPTTERCPACWGTGWLCDPHDVGDCPECCSSTSLHGCPICTPPGGCGGTGTTEPIPAKGHQRVWEWTP